MLMSFGWGTAVVVLRLHNDGTRARGSQRAILGFFDRLCRFYVSARSHGVGRAPAYLGPSGRRIERDPFQLPSFSVTSIGSLQYSGSIGFATINRISADLDLFFFLFVDFCNVFLFVFCELIDG